MLRYFLRNAAGGCNAAVAAGRAVLREIRGKQLQQTAADTGRCGTPRVNHQQLLTRPPAHMLTAYTAHVSLLQC